MSLSLKRGINIGDHFENESENPGEYKNPIQDWYFDFIQRLGFDHIRLPVRWSVHCNENDGYKIDERFFSDVQNTVNEFLNRGIAVLLDVHHFRECMAHPLENREKLAALWEQIADRFKDYPEKLVFEILNEPDWQCKVEDWNIVQNEMISLIRKSNPDRWLAVGAVNYNEVYHMPELVLPDDNRLIGVFHYYFPLEFTHQGAPWTTRYVGLHDIHWLGTDEELKFMKDTVGIAVEWSKNTGHPLVLDEFGVYEKADMADRVRWTRALRRECERNGIAWTYWELNRNFGICEKTGQKLKTELVDALLKD